ncbi:hypothetical protein [Hymenobacter crusticola]|uniref:Uncharacterized protein n=1 Tax=Hymenobacter crusticola TaxID=1770526 RepID=A0A243WFT1_9BACT|nr:hypothetical protein [Hymenobacter crusticola]OUJ74604.1 hypothetical protein BXP70_07465 [Hymenobacter crusticola]
MVVRVLLLLICWLFVAGCARQRFFQTDARLPGAAPLAATADSARVTAGRHYRAHVLHRVFFGRHYRHVWTTPVTVPVLNPQTAVPGGLQAGKLGGGFQSTSMTLLGRNDREYALRTLDKDPYKTLPKTLQKTFVLDLVRDATSAINPYGAFVVPPLAEAAGVLHTTPQLFYIRADEKGLGENAPKFQGKLALLEEKFDGKSNLTPAFGNAQDLEDSDDVLRMRYQNPDHQFDQLAFARARLLDIWLGDWDRHEGQWQWAVYAQQDRTLYRPIPKDRDQVFYRFDDGLVPWLVSRPFIVGKLRTFKPHYESIDGLVKNARFIDERALNELTSVQFQKLALDLQSRLTDDAIEKALRRLPPPIYQLEGARTAAALRTRRASLPVAARAYYRLLARQVTVVGTDQAERFVVQRLTDSTTQVQVYATANKLMYARTFRSTETKLITLHGLGGEDTFEVSGDVTHGIRINIFGGPNRDEVKDSSHVRHSRKKTFYYDTRSGNTLEAGPSTRDRTRKGVEAHTYDREGD